MRYKYYFKKPKSEIAKDIILGLALAGSVLAVSALSPYSTASALLRLLKNKRYNKKNCYNVFYRLKKQGYLATEIYNHQIYISLTAEGKKKAGRFQIDSLSIKKPKKWDKKWRIVIFDIAQLKKMHREAFRGKLKTLGFYLLQKSVWVCPFNCKDEIELLRSFFGLNESELRFIVAEDVGSSEELRKFFKI